MEKAGTAEAKTAAEEQWNAAMRLGCLPGRRYGPMSASGGIAPVQADGKIEEKASSFTPKASMFYANAQGGDVHACFGYAHCLEYVLFHNRQALIFVITERRSTIM